MQFAKPLAGDEGATTCVQKTASSDILEYENGMRHSILPGDKVLAPWEREQKRFGPGTVIRGIETRDPLRGKNPIALPLPEIRESYTPEGTQYSPLDLISFLIYCESGGNIFLISKCVTEI